VDLDTDQRDELFRGLSDRATVRGDIEFYRYVNECSYHFYMFLDLISEGRMKNKILDLYGLRKPR
jgi:hypothetical protein